MSVRTRMVVVIGGVFGGMAAAIVAGEVVVDHVPLWAAVLVVLGSYAGAAILLWIVVIAVNWAMKGER